jgi:hypothetical protein
LVLCERCHTAAHTIVSVEGTKVLERGPAPRSSEVAKPSEAPVALNLSDDDIRQLAALISEEQNRGTQKRVPTGGKEVHAIARTWRFRTLVAGTAGLGVVAAGALWLYSGDDTTQSGRLGCSDVTYAEAQRLLRDRPQEAGSLDGDGDGEACEASK